MDPSVQAALSHYLELHEGFDGMLIDQDHGKGGPLQPSTSLLNTMGVVKTVSAVEEYCLYTSVDFVRLLVQGGLLDLSGHYPYKFLILL